MTYNEFLTDVMNLEEEINRYLREECSNDDEPGVHEIAEHFAQWQRQQMMKEAVEGSITSASGALGYDIAAFRFDDNHKYTILLSHKEGRKHGDKVRIIITEEE